MKAKKAWINKDECGAFLLCVEQASGLVKEGGQEVASEIEAKSVSYTEEQTKHLISAAYICPLGAIYIELEDGTVLNEVGEKEFEKYVGSPNN